MDKLENDPAYRTQVQYLALIDAQRAEGGNLFSPELRADIAHRVARMRQDAMNNDPAVRAARERILRLKGIKIPKPLPRKQPADELLVSRL
jgi:hypothetical protein